MARQTRSQRRARREAQAATGAGAPPRRGGNGGGRPPQPLPAGHEPAVVHDAPRRGIPGVRFVGESWAELKKVEWPGQNQVIQGTVVVLIACAIVGVYLYLNDIVWKHVVQNVFLK